MSEIRVGSLLQHKINHYGKYYPRLPRVPWSPDYMFLKNSFETTDKQLIESLLKYQEDNFFEFKEKGFYGIKKDQKKFGILAAKIEKVFHPMLPSRPCIYVKCFISDPYIEGETIDGYVQADWMEVLTENVEYKQDSLSKAREAYFKLKQKK